MDQLAKVKKIKRDNEKNWLLLPEVVSVGIGYVKEKQPGIVIGVKRKHQAHHEKIPDQIDNVKIVIKKIDEIKAL